MSVEFVEDDGDGRYRPHAQEVGCGIGPSSGDIVVMTFAGAAYTAPTVALQALEQVPYRGAVPPTGMRQRNGVVGVR